MIEFGPERKEIEKIKLDLGKRIVVLMGPEGAGKSVLAKRLATDSGKPYISTGDTIRHLAEVDQGRYGDEYRGMLREHRYLDPKILLEILISRFAKSDTRDGFIIDGSMRTVQEVIDLKPVLAQAGREMPLDAVLLRIPGWMGADRLIFNEQARKRNDDTPEGVLGRMGKYYFKLGERARLIREQTDWRLLIVRATETIENNYERVIQTLLEN